MVRTLALEGTVNNKACLTFVRLFFPAALMSHGFPSAAEAVFSSTTAAILLQFSHDQRFYQKLLFCGHIKTFRSPVFKYRISVAPLSQIVSPKRTLQCPSSIMNAVSLSSVSKSCKFPASSSIMPNSRRLERAFSNLTQRGYILLSVYKFFTFIFSSSLPDRKTYVSRPFYK